MKKLIITSVLLLAALPSGAFFSIQDLMEEAVREQMREDSLKREERRQRPREAYKRQEAQKEQHVIPSHIIDLLKSGKAVRMVYEDGQVVFKTAPVTRTKYARGGK